MRKIILPNDQLTVRILFLNVMLFLFIVNINAQTILTVKGVEFTIMPNSVVSVKGDLFVTKSTQILDGKTQVKDGEILNNGSLYVSDSIINETDQLFSKTSNPYLSSPTKDNSLTSGGTVIFNGESTQSIKNKKPNLILFHNISIENPNGIKLNDSITALGKVDPIHGSLFLNGKDLKLFYGIKPFYKYDGFIGTETNKYKIWDTTQVRNFKILGDRRSGHIVAYYPTKPQFDSCGAKLGLTINAISVQTDTFQRGNLNIPYAGNGSVRKYFILKSSDKANGPYNYSISYLDSSDFKDLHIKEPDFRLFLNQGNSPVTYEQEDGSVDISSNKVNGNITLSPSRFYVLTIGDSACDNPPKANINAITNVCQGVPFTLTTKNLVSTYSQMVYYKWYKNGILINDSSNVVKDTIKSTDPTNAIYKVKIYDNRGCFSYSSDTVTSHPIPVAGFKKDDHGTGYCAGI